MRNLFKVFVAAVFSLAVVNTAPAGAVTAPQIDQNAGDQSAGDPKAAEKAFNAAKTKDWAQAAKYAEQANDPLTVKIIDWLRYQQTDPNLTFATIAGFIGANPNWPRMSRLRRSAEAAIGTGDDPATLNDWFQRYPPLTGAGALAHLDALTAIGEVSKARDLIPQYWQDLNYKGEEDKEFQRKYGRHLATADQITRLDRLIWDHQYWPAKRMLPRVDAPQAALGSARLALMRSEAGVDGAIAKVPTALREAPGLQYERLRWRRRKGRDQAARDLLIAAQPLDAYQEKWATERLILARRALLEGRYAEAKRIVDSRDLNRGAKFAEVEFLAGWISLTFLNQPVDAYRHFTRLYTGVGYPISRARGAFWAGRAASEVGDQENAQGWWRLAAEFPATFYGQQAIAALGERDTRIPFTSPQDLTPTADNFEPELVQAVRLLHLHGQKPLITSFLRNLTELSTTLAERFAVIRLANEVDHPHEAVRAAKRAAQLDHVVPAPGYPFLPFENAVGDTGNQRKDSPLVLALIRQESAFDPRAQSGVGARGMMQLMPATAQKVARAAGKPYSRDRLLDDPRYNIQLGTAYLDTMMSRFDRSPALALAAYNAGPSRVDRWIRQFGDPRTGEIGLIDWIESIPFGETRNYVQRVLESETVYRELQLNEQLASVPTLPAPATFEGSSGYQP